MPRPKDVLPSLVTHGRLIFTWLKHDAFTHHLLKHLRWLRAWLALTFACLQNRNGEVGKGMNSAEWCHVLEHIIKHARASWAEAHPDVPFSECIFMYDNPSFHNLDEGQKAHLLRPGVLLDSLDQLQQPPCYSGDLMQCIEHVHALICSEWWKDRFRNGEPLTNEEREADLSTIFYKRVGPDSVKANVRKLMRLIDYIIQTGTGDYAPPSLT